MRAVLAAVVFATLANLADADARTTETAAEARAAGTLTCRMRTDLGLVVGTARVAACTFTAPDGLRRPYAALLPPRADGEGRRVLTWRVVTAEGRERMERLDGVFAGDASGDLRGPAATLAPLDAAGETSLRLAAHDSRIAAGAR